MTDNTEARIRLAQWMGWKWEEREYGITGQPTVVWINPAGKTVMQPPDPFTDANDDYAVLTHFRSIPHCKLKASFFWELSDWNAAGYEVGDYARASLAVLDEREKAP
ncbi:MAG: hypothetical protein AAFX44_06750 [Pseudomonadota bacterium]